MRHLERCEGRGSDGPEMVAKIAKSICRYPAGDPTPTTLIGGKTPGQGVVQAVSPQSSNSPSVESVFAFLQAEQLPVEEGEEPQWVDVFGVVHPGLVPPEVLEDVVENERFSVNIPRPVNFDLLLGKKRLRKSIPSWLQINATPLGGKSELDWTVESFFMFGGLSIWCAKQGSFKSILSLLLALALLQADQNPDTDVRFLGRPVKAVPRITGDKRPLRVYFLDNDSPRTLTENNCSLVGLDPYRANGTFVLFGAWEDHSIVAMDDPRLIEAAKRDRCVFIFDCLGSFSEGLNPSDPKDMNYVMPKAKKLGHMSEGVLILHHDNKKGEGWSGSTAIVSNPDMSFNLAREDGTNRVTFKEIRFKGCEKYTIDAELFFNKNNEDSSSSGLVAGDGKVTSITYKVHKDTLDPVTRNLEQIIKEANKEYRRLTPEEKAAKKAKVREEAEKERKIRDGALIDRAMAVIKERGASGLSALTQNGLSKILGIKDHKVAARVLCASTPEDPRPWLTCLDKAARSLLFFCDEKQRNIFEGVDPEFDAKLAAKEIQKKNKAAKKKEERQLEKDADSRPLSVPAPDDAVWNERVQF